MQFKHISVGSLELHIGHNIVVREILCELVCFLLRKLCIAQQKNWINPVFVIIIKLIAMVLKWAFCTEEL